MKSWAVGNAGRLFVALYVSHFIKTVCFVNMNIMMGVCRKSPGARLNIKTVFPRYGDSHVKDKPVKRVQGSPC